MTRNVGTLDGHMLGRELARLVDEADPRARLVEPLIPPRCASCAFRAGLHIPNGSPSTLATAIECALVGIEFSCHEPRREGQSCSGWLMLLLGGEGSELDALAERGVRPTEATR